MKACNAIALLQFNQSGDVIDCNEISARFFGYQDRCEMLHRKWSSLIVEDFAHVKDETNGVLNSNLVRTLTIRHVTGSRRFAVAKVVWQHSPSLFETTLHVVLMKTRDHRPARCSNPNAHSGVPTHIASEPQSLPKELQASEIRYRNIVEEQTDLVCRFDAALRLTFANRAYCDSWRHSTQEILGKSIMDNIPEHEQESVRMHILGLTKKKPITTMIRQSLQPDHRPQWLEWTNRALFDEGGNFIEYQGIGRDITERKLTEEALAASEERYRSLIESTDAAISMVDYDGHYLYLNGSALKPFGVTPSDFIGKTLFDVFSEAQAKAILADVRNVIDSNQGITREREAELLGKRAWYRSSIQPVRNSVGKPFAAHIHATDITDRKVAELALRMSEERYRQMFELHGLPKLIIDPENGAIVDANPAAGQFYGYDPVILKTFNILDVNLSPQDEVYAKMAQARSIGMLSCQFLHRCAGGQTRHVEIFTGPLKINHKQYLYSIIVDITEREQTKSALEKANERLEQRVKERTIELEMTKNRFEAIFNHSGDGILLLDEQNRIQQANSAFAALVGLTADNYTGRQLSAFVVVEDMLQFETILEQVAKTGQKQQIEVRAISSKGVRLDVEISIAPLNHDEQFVRNLVCIVRDISERKKVEEALRRSERELRESQKRLQMVLDTIPVRVFWKDRDSVLQGCNRLFAQDAGFEHVAEFLAYEQAKRMVKHISPDRYRHEDLTVMETGNALLEYDQLFKRATGEELVIQTSKLPLRNEAGKIVGLLGVYVDITARRRAEEELAQKYDEEQEMQGYLKALHDVTLHLTQTETLDDFYYQVVAMGLKHFGFDRMGFWLSNEENAEAVGTYGTDIAGKIVSESHLKQKLQNIPEELRSALQYGQRFIFLPDVTLFANGEQLHRGQSAIAALWHQGTLGWLSIDNALKRAPITKAQLDILSLYAITVSSLLTRKKAETALRESEEKFRIFIESAPIATFITDEKGTILLVNHETERLFGYKRDALLGQSAKLLTPEVSDSTQTSHAWMLNWQAKGSQTETIEQPMRRKNGVLFPADLQLRYIITNSQPLIMHLVIDITQRKQAELALRQSLEQEKELSQLKSHFVSMASHEFRTPLTAILSATETISVYRDKMTTAQIDARLGKIREQVFHMRDIMEDVLHLERIQSGRSAFKPSVGDLDIVCQKIIEELEEQPGYRGRTIYSSDIPSTPFLFDEQLIKHVLNNLISNALKYSSPDKSVCVTLTEHCNQVQLTIRDQGIGIPAAELKNLFEPFHRASNVGKIAGTGLGLSIAKQAVELHNGTLSLESQIGVGTIFVVKLPKVLAEDEMHLVN